MRKFLNPASANRADTPPDGDFARYVEDLVGQQAAHLAGGQRMTDLTQTSGAAQPKRPAKPQKPSAQHGASKVAEAKTQSVADLVQVLAASRTSSEAEAAKPTWAAMDREVNAVRESARSNFKFPPVLAVFLVISILGVILYTGVFSSFWLLLILAWVFGLPRILRRVVAKLGSTNGPSQRK